MVVFAVFYIRSHVKMNQVDKIGGAIHHERNNLWLIESRFEPGIVRKINQIFELLRRRALQ